ncbi:MAG TPA: DUF6325 family protein [Ornithinimicrobium sp.]|uniref:DUF6325 family protein n=1 Tax=Ornithinimicrobium sp. TaxID=1977084 RepID=UPI002B461067|nr:DUF6325 family protein [Ornithinimicrobium sp.]HKJ11467.1 DUF6325 family protein [Ornithinimicrobium sp.]
MEASHAGPAPLDILVIGFEGNEFSGDIAPEIARLSEAGTVRVVDLVFVRKEADGSVAAVTAAELGHDGPSGLPELEVLQPGALGIEDTAEISDDLPAHSSALIIAFENTWAARFVAAVRDSRGEVLRYTRVPADLAATTLDQSAGDSP